MSTPDLDAVPLDALIAAVRRRCQNTVARAVMNLGQLTVDVGAPRAIWRGCGVRLSAREVDVLIALMGAHPRGLTGRELTNLLWAGGDDRAARWYICSLRRRLPGLIPPLPSKHARAPYCLAAA